MWGARLRLTGTEGLAEGQEPEKEGKDRQGSTDSLGEKECLFSRRTVTRGLASGNEQIPEENHFWKRSLAGLVRQ